MICDETTRRYVYVVDLVVRDDFLRFIHLRTTVGKNIKTAILDDQPEWTRV